MAMRSLVAELTAAFHEQSPLINLEVTGGGTQYGLESLRAGEVDVALASWLPGDLESEFRAVTIARDAVAIIVHPDNPVDGLGLLQLQDLFSGRAQEWRAVGGRPAQGLVQPVSREEGSGSREAFEMLVMDDQVVTPLAIVAPSPEAVVEYVAGHQEAIGYLSTGYLPSEVKALRIEGAQPLVESVEQGRYPLVQDLLLIVDEPTSEAVQSFLDFVLGPAGQEIVGRQHGRVR
jgi:phosphate transport system substrate-binding protein